MKVNIYKIKRNGKRKYSHFDKRVGLLEAYSYVSNKENIEKHNFYPFIYYEKKTMKYSKTEGKREKIRPICYAAHIDRCIYQYYSYIFNEKYNDKAITNIHGITLKQKEHNSSKGIFVKLFLDYLRDKGMIDAYAVGGNGGSLAIKYWNYLKFPNFPLEIEKEITSLYYNNLNEYNINNCSIESFEEYDNNYNKIAGIYELDKSKNYLQELLENTIKKIADDIEVKTNFLID